MRLLLFTVFTFLVPPLSAQSNQELWDELEIAKENKTSDLLELQAFQKQIEKAQTPDQDFVEQTISTGMAGLKKNGRAPRSGQGPKIEETPLPNKTIFEKRNFKAPRSRSR